MSTTRPRITVTLTDHQHAVLKRMSELSGSSMSYIVCDFLDTALPMLERVVVAMQAASQASQEVKDGLVQSFTKAEQEILPELSRMMGQLDMLLEPVPAAGSAQAGPAVGSGTRRRKDPPTSNRGVRIPSSNRRKASTGAASKAVGKGSKK